MARTGLLVWLYCLILASVNVVHVLSSTVLPGIGVNWGTMASNPLPRNIVVNMLKDNGITKVKLFDSDSPTLKALAGTGIEVMVGIPNNQMSIVAGDIEDAEDWVKENITAYLHNGGVDIKLVEILFSISVCSCFSPLFYMNSAYYCIELILAQSAFVDMWLLGMSLSCRAIITHMTILHSQHCKTFKRLWTKLESETKSKLQ
jgi:hypothetical protein